ncbi:uncharacterized protein YndB with AHSA1/START domain [Saccharomonospora amisosensis]|uniref:Uncharacterized protein YndB with AHSA1/START domain n=1 Tax=Saccharomonospora amisosensis TaxID=1128677 RepID=A0A7X5UQ19_9PSEU|nr:SRPBCC family protein [Saccharomonospora amisosensis]NIJ12107.1 uncharacterized protein YndB with AHSA1/START domain [Saccharomonospora amisosensis]
MTASKYQTQILADPDLPTIRIVREFDAPRERVFRAFTESNLVAQWTGPRSGTTRIDRWDCRTGGNYRYATVLDGSEYCFYGSFHEVRAPERIVQTFTYEDMPDGVSLETATLEDLGGGRTRVTMLSVLDSMQARDGLLASGMEVGVVEGFEKLDELVAGSA